MRSTTVLLTNLTLYEEENGCQCTVFIQYCTFPGDNIQTKLKRYFFRLHGTIFIKVFLVSILWSFGLIRFVLTQTEEQIQFITVLKSLNIRLVLFIFASNSQCLDKPNLFVFSLSISKLFLMALMYGFQCTLLSQAYSGLLKSDLNVRIFCTMNLFRTAKSNWDKKLSPSLNHYLMNSD